MVRKMLAFCFMLLLAAVPAAADSAGQFEQHLFTDGEEIRLVQEDGLVTLRSIRFKRSERRVHAVILAYCDEGKDQLIELDIALLDQAGNIVAVLSGKGKIEEEEKAKFKITTKISPDRLQAVESFQIALFARPD
jgi:hypothetical protein